MLIRLRLVLIATISVLLIAAPALAGGNERSDPDPRFQVEHVEVVVDPDGVIWLKVQFAEPWGDKPPSDLFSGFFQVFFSGADFFLDVGWQTHDGETDAGGFDADGEFLPEMYILSDGCVLINTGLTTDDEVAGLQGGAASASMDDPSSNRLDAFGELNIQPSDFIHGDPFVLFGPPVYDLANDEMLTVAPTTTTTTEPAQSDPPVSTESTTTTSTPGTTTGPPTSGETTSPPTSTSTRTGEDCLSCWAPLVVLVLALVCAGYFWLRRYPWWSCWLPWFFVVWLWAPLFVIWAVFFGGVVAWWWLPLLLWFPAIGWVWWWWARRRSWWLPWMVWVPIGWMAVLALVMVLTDPAWWWLVVFWLPAAGYYLWYRGRKQPWWLPWMWYAFGVWVLLFFVWAIWGAAGWLWWVPLAFFLGLGWWVWRSSSRSWEYWGPKLCWLIPWALIPVFEYWIVLECYYHIS